MDTNEEVQCGMSKALNEVSHLYDFSYDKEIQELAVFKNGRKIGMITKVFLLDQIVFKYIDKDVAG